MARGTQFSVLVSRLRAETRRSTDVSVGVDDIDSVKETLNHTYEALYDGHNWPHLLKVFSKNLAAGQRYYDYPSGLNLERVTRAVVYHNSTPLELDHGIDFEQYATFDPDQDERSEPALRWDSKWTGSSVQIEIWPLPSTNTQVLWMRGYQSISRLVNDSDLCLLDDTLVVLFAAAELLGKSLDADVKLRLARERLNMLKTRGQAASKGHQLGLGRDTSQRPKIEVRVAS